MTCRYLLFCIILLMFNNLPVLSQEKTDNKEIEIIMYNKIPVSDGINLSARIYKPLGNEKYPAIFWFTPYVADEQQPYGIYFAQNGYIFVAVDVRGRGDSEGEFYPLENDGKDGAKVVEWIAKQPWCDGKVGMMGGSYRGMVQWQTLMNLPNALKTIVPTASVGPGVDFPQPNNIFYSYDIRWLALVSGNTDCRKLFEDSDYWNSKFYRLQADTLPFEKLDSICGFPYKIFQRWISHPLYDDYWRAMTPQPDDYKKIDIPILTITGYYDDDQRGALNYYFNHLKHGSENAIKNHYLVIGPYDHSGTRKPRKDVGGLIIPDNAILDMNKLQLEWFDWVLKGKAKPEFLKNRVNYYMPGDDEWKYADKIEDVSNKKMLYYLSSDGAKAGDIFGSGRVNESITDDTQPDLIKYDPRSRVNINDYMNPQENYLIDQADAFREDRLVYHSDKIEKDLEIAGIINFKAYIELNVPDCDIFVTIYEITDKGKSILLGSDIMRVRYRNSLTREELVKPGEINLYSFSTFPFIAKKIKKGSRLRLVLGPLNSPDYQKNYNSGGNINKETARNAKQTIIKLYHNKKYPSRIEIPIKE
jgi:uncharacterized protein